MEVIDRRSIRSDASLAGLVRASISEIKIFTHGSSLHYVSLPVAHVRSKDERQTLIQIVALFSKIMDSHRKRLSLFELTPVLCSFHITEKQKV
jgi:hypothetical protein